MTGVELIAAERKRQIEEEGWTPEHDAQHYEGELAIAGACYALGEKHVHVHIPRRINSSRGIDENCYQYDFTKAGPEQITWPWNEKWWKPKDRIRDLVRAGALIAAEVDRLQNNTR